MSANDTLLQVTGLTKDYPARHTFLGRKGGTIRAVDDVSFHIERGETLGLVGESGCGKTTTARCILRAVEPTEGKILFHDAESDVDVRALKGPALREFRKHMQLIFQDPYSSLNPRMTVSQIIEEPLKIHTSQTAAERKERVGWLLDKVGLSREQASRYAHEFSGGQRQRIGIARALTTNPKIIIADEPVSALDVSIQAQVINLMQDLQEEFNLSYIFIAHDLSVVRHISERIAVMYLGNLVEFGPAEKVYTTPMHPYSRALLSAVPRPVPGQAHERIRLTGDVPNPIQKPSGCSFHTRCPMAENSCSENVPAFEFRNGRFVACPLV